jgi:S1-C subfamily serine protease
LVGHTHGFEVTSVTPGSAADRAGITIEDVIVEIDGIPVREAGDLQRLMTEARIGTGLQVRLVRGGRIRTVEVVPEELATR